MIQKLCMANQLPAEGQLKAFVGGTAAVPVALCVGMVDGRAYAIDNACPHARASLAGGDLCGTAVVCPVHGWQWDIVTGQPLRPGDPAVTTYEVRVYGAEAFVRVPGEWATPAAQNKV